MHQMVETLQGELRTKSDEDRVVDEARRGQTETQLATLGANIESLH